MSVLKFTFNILFLACLVNGVEFGQKHGWFGFVLNSPLMMCPSHDRSLERNVNGIKIFFYDFTNNVSTSFPISEAAKNILDIKHLDKGKKFIMYIGGYTSRIDKRDSENMRRAYATYPNSYLIIPDHSPYTNYVISKILGYRRAVRYAYYIGKALGKMWADLKEGGISPKNIQCVGHSLGGQILGHVGETFFKLTGQKINRITALDPAGPCFSSSSIQDQVRSGVAEYVEVFHCNSGEMGSSKILGDVDYIVNEKGETQPGCTSPEIASIKAAYCNHRACVDVWSASVKRKELFTAYSCKKFMEQDCVVDETVAGAWGPATARGIYFLSTSNYNLSEIS